MEFFSAEYNHAVIDAFVNGMKVLFGMLLAAGIFNVISGGPQARTWKKNASH